MNVNDLEFDREKTLNWWVGRISNADFAEWTDQSVRDIQIILSKSLLARGVTGGGRGSKHTRRISRQARNAVAIVAAMRRAGMTTEAAAELINSYSVIASHPTAAVDFDPGLPLAQLHWTFGAKRMPAIEDPSGGWLPTDSVPYHVMHNRERPLAREGQDKITPGDLGWLPTWREEQFGGIPDGWISMGEPLYRPEIDPAGIYDFGNTLPDTQASIDHHIFIVDGRFVYLQHPHPEPREYLLDQYLSVVASRPRRFSSKLDLTVKPILEIDGKEFLPIGGDERREAEAMEVFDRFETKLDVNTTYAVRKMKRRALGLVKE